MKEIANPCEKCRKKKEGCQARCYPLKDYNRAVRNRRNKGGKERGGQIIDRPNKTALKGLATPLKSILISAVAEQVDAKLQGLDF